MLSNSGFLNNSSSYKRNNA